MGNKIEKASRDRVDIQDSELVKFLVKNRNHIFLALCLLIHIIYFFAFLCLEVYPAMWLNLFSIAVYTVMVVILKIKNEPAIIIAYFEIISFAMISTIMLGMEMGFYLYILGMFMVILNLCPSLGNNRFTLQLIGAAFLIIIPPLAERFGEHFIKYHEQLYPIRGIFHTGNIILVIFCDVAISFMCVVDLDTSNKKIRHKMEHDELTQLYSRTYLKSYMENYQDDTGEDFFSVIMLDIDNFKKINDTYGHDMGDTALCYLANVLKRNTRFDDKIIRWGGEEFLIFLHNCPYENAVKIAESLRRAVMKDAYSTEYPNMRLTVTLGVSVTRPSESYEKAINRADKLLYKGKNSGKNKVVAEYNTPLY